MTSAESRFRSTERQLDEAISRDRTALADAAIETKDDSAREYHYKDDRLAWRFRFEARRARGSEIEKVTVTMTVDEGNTTLCDVWRRAELFQTGQLSRWQVTDESTVPVKDVCENGIANLVRPLIEKAQTMLATH